MKSGTTSLFRWLEDLPEVSLPAKKEIDFFSENWSRGVSWYESQFPSNGLTGEASPSYTSYDHAESAATRISECYPQIRLVFLAREPVDRARSHYRHEVQRGRENRPFYDAVGIQSRYVRYSLYAHNLRPFTERFAKEHLLVVRFEDLVSGEPEGWHAVLDFLGLSLRGLPDPVHTPSVDKPQYTSLFRGLWGAGALRYLRKLPRPVRTLGKRLLMRETPEYRSLLDSSYDEPADEVRAILQVDSAEFGRMLGRSLWD